MQTTIPSCADALLFPTCMGSRNSLHILMPLDLMIAYRSVLFNDSCCIGFHDVVSRPSSTKACLVARSLLYQPCLRHPTHTLSLISVPP